jgi:hypothetical protein
MPEVDTNNETTDPKDGPDDHHHDHGDHDHHWLQIIINAQPKEVDDRELSYHDVLMLAYDGNPPSGPNWSISVTYSRGPVENPHGTLTPGHSVKIKEDMVFRVKATDRS